MTRTSTEYTVQMADLAVEADLETLRMPLSGIVAAVGLGAGLWTVIAWSLWSILTW